MPKLQGELRKLYSPDVELANFRQDGPFGFLVSALVGPRDGQGEETFDFMLCSPDWFAAQMTAAIELGRHYVFMKHYDHMALERFVRDYCATCTGESWDDVALKIGRLGHWEFEDYQPGPGLH